MNKLFLLFGLMALVSCSTMRKNNSYDYISYGQGGGISGEVKGFEINNGSELYSVTKKVNGEAEKKLIRSLTQKEQRTISKKIKSAQALDYIYKELDNYYYYLEVQKAPLKNYITWGGNKSPSKSIRELYDYLYFISN
jgi:uncharacterized protein (DUF2164 family)